MLIAAVVAVAGIIGLFLFLNSDEAVIKKRFTYLADQFARESPENNLMGAAKANKIGNMFADGCRVAIPGYDVDRTFTRDDVPPYVMMARSRYNSISIDFYDFNIGFPRDGQATVNVTAFVRATSTAGEAVQEIHEMVFSLEKGEEAWLFTDIESVEVLEK
jgi:hypothetical protein